MKKLISILLAMAAFASCQPEVYTGPLDSPVGNWDGVKSEYCFNGERVGEAEGCEYTAISFYPDGLCCIEGLKGAFPYSYDNSTGMMYIDNTVWAVQTMTGAELVMEYLETIFPEDDQSSEGLPQPDGSDTSEEGETEEPGEPEVKPDENGLILPIEYEGVTIYADNNGYYYEAGNEKIYCKFFGSRDDAGKILKDESGAVIIDFWYDTHTDYFIPLVVEVKK